MAPSESVAERRWTPDSRSRGPKSTPSTQTRMEGTPTRSRLGTQPDRRAREPQYRRGDLFQTALGPRQRVERLEAGEGVEDLLQLRPVLRSRPAVPLGEAVDQDPRDLPPAGVARLERLTQLRVQHPERSEEHTSELQS